MSRLAGIADVRYLSARITKQTRINEIGRHHFSFDPIALDQTGILHILVMASNSTKDMELDELYELSEVVVRTSLYSQ